MMVEPDGCTRRQHYESIARQTGRVIPELDVKPLPFTCSEIWKWFMNLNQSRQSGFGVNAISYSEMKAYFDLINVQPTEDELTLIRMLDNILLDIYNKEQKKESKK